MDKRGRQTRVLVSLLFLFLACCQHRTEDHGGRTLTVVAPWKIQELDPLVSGYVFVRMGCIETLTESDGKGGVKPRLAVSWEVSQDMRTWRFTLRRGVRFHDGTPLTAEAVVRSLRRVFQRHRLFAASDTRIESITSAGDRSILITTAVPFAPLPTYLAHYATAIISPACFISDQHVSAVIGTGPYRFVSLKMETLLELEAFEAYWGGKPIASRVRYCAIGNPETRAMMAESGEADLALTLSAASKELLENNDRVKILSTIMPRVRILKMNTNMPFFDSEDERRAVSLAIDRETIARTLLDNPKMAATQILPPTVNPWHDPRLKPLRFDPVAAAHLLKRNGWERGPDGVLRKGGDRFAVDLITYASRPMLPVIAQALQAQLERVGIELRISVVQGSMILQRHNDGTLQAALYSQNFGLIPDAVGTIAFDFGPKSVRWGWGAMGWESAKMNRLIRQYFSAFNPLDAAEIRGNILRLAQAELPLIPLTWYDHHTAVTTRIRGLELDPYELRPYLEGVRWAD